MNKEMTLYQIEKAQEFAKYFKILSEAMGYPDIDLAFDIFDKVNGINEDDECCDCPCDDISLDFEKYKWTDNSSKISEYMNEQLNKAKGLFNNGNIESKSSDFASKKSIEVDDEGLKGYDNYGNIVLNIDNDGYAIFSGKLETVKAHVINCCNCTCS